MHSQNTNKVAVIGGGAAGFFAAIHAAEKGNSVTLFEKTTKLLSKVKVSGGGRCNVTHYCLSAADLVKYYPRGGKSLRNAFERFGVRDTINWFEERGVRLKTEADGRMFPTTDNSQTIIDCLLDAAKRLKIEISTAVRIDKIEPQNQGFLLTTNYGKSFNFQSVVITTGGSNKPKDYEWLKELGLKVAPPLPSLFTFNVPHSPVKDLMGLSVPNGEIKIPGTKWKSTGPILITHWGFSAPAVIKLSAWAAKDLHKLGYSFPLHINWTGKHEEEIRNQLQQQKNQHPKKTIKNTPLFDIPKRLWERLIEIAEIPPEQLWHDLSKKKLNAFWEKLIRFPVEVSGKTTFKEEFVTCGGVELSEVNLKTFESKKYPGLFFAGEILNVDGVTGGFNFQHAWTSGALAGSAIN